MDNLSKILVILQIYQSLLFAALSFTVFFRSGDHSKNFLGWFMMLSALFAIYKGAYTPGLYYVFWYLFPIGIPLFLSFFPIFYFYIKSLVIQEYQFSNRELIHFIPATFLVLLSVPYYYLTYETKDVFASKGSGLFEGPLLKGLKYTYYICVYGYFNVQVILYSIKVSRLYKMHKFNIETTFSYKNSISLSWVIILTLMFVALLILLDVSYLIGLNTHHEFHILINVLVFFITLFFCIYGTLQRDIYPVRKIIGNGPEATENDMTTVTKNEITDAEQEHYALKRKYVGSSLSDVQKRALVKKLDGLIGKKIYLNEKLSIVEVADKLDTNSKY